MSQLIMYGATWTEIEGGNTEPLDDRNSRLFFVLEVFKLLRLFRIKKIMIHSELMSVIWERVNIEITLTCKIIFIIMLMSHWIACIWGLIAYVQAGSFSEEALLSSVNWISWWYKEFYGDGYIDGGLYPLGWSNAIQRYW